MTPSQAIKLKAMIKMLVKAEIENSWKGGKDPSDIPEIEAELQAAKVRLESYIRSLTSSL